MEREVPTTRMKIPQFTSAEVAADLGLPLNALMHPEGAPPEARHAAAQQGDLPPVESGLQQILASADDAMETPQAETLKTETPPAETPAETPKVEANAGAPTDTGPVEPAAPPAEELPDPGTIETWDALVEAMPETQRAFLERGRALSERHIAQREADLKLELDGQVGVIRTANDSVRSRLEAALAKAEKDGFVEGAKDILAALDEKGSAWLEREAQLLEQRRQVELDLAQASWDSLRHQREADLRLLAANPRALGDFKAAIGNRALMESLPGTLPQRMATALDLVFVRHPTLRPTPAQAAPPVARLAASSPAAPPPPAPAPVQAPPVRPVVSPVAPPQPARVVAPERSPVALTPDEILAQAAREYRTGAMAERERRNRR